MSIMGEMNPVSGERRVNGSVSYVPQEAWVMSASIRENVVLDADFNLKRHKLAIEASALDKVNTSVSNKNRVKSSQDNFIWPV